MSSGNGAALEHGARGAFVWRGDHDLYDPGTLQCATGLRRALGLAARFRMPTSVMLSARLSLVREEHEAFCRQFGWERHSEEIPAFIRFWREEVDTALEQEFPTRAERPLAAGIGNHCYLHYGTHAAADPATAGPPMPAWAGALSLVERLALRLFHGAAR